MRYKIHNKEKSLSLGVYPVVELKQARQLAQAERVKLANNIDLSIDRKINKQKSREATDKSSRIIALEWHAKQHTWTETHAKSVFRKLEADVFSYIGVYTLSQIEAPQLLNTIRFIEPLGYYDLAHRVLGFVVKFPICVSTGRCSRDRNPDLRGALTLHKEKIKLRLNPRSYPS